MSKEAMEACAEVGMIFLYVILIFATITTISILVPIIGKVMFGIYLYCG